MAKKIAIGKMFYLFRSRDGKITAEDHLLITSHGGYLPTTSYFTIPNWTFLHFYGPHQYALIDPTIANIIDGKYRVLETNGPGSRVKNYELSKFQGEKHGSKNETYTTIERDIDGNEMKLNIIQMNASKGRKTSNFTAGNFAFHFDVLTVRNRWFTLGGLNPPSLSTALNSLGKVGYRYENIHCSFCRVSPFASDKMTKSAENFSMT